MPENDGGWGNWSNELVSESDDSEWLVNPREATRKTIERAGRELAAQANANAAQQAAYVGQMTATAARFDAEFASEHPDLMGTETERLAVGLAIQKCLGHPKFVALLRDPGTRKKGFAVVARLARDELGRNDAAVSQQRPSDRVYDNLIHRTTSPAREREAMSELISAALGSGKGGSW